MEGARHGTAGLATAAATLLVVPLAGCRPAATQVTIVLGSDAPADRALTVVARVSVEDGGSQSGPSWVFGGGGAGMAALPASFAVTPAASAARDGHVTLVLEAELAAGGPTEPARQMRRTARFSFVPHAQTRLPLFLAIACTDRTDGCTTAPPERCTVSAWCEERGQTCGDSGRCVPAETTPDLVPPGERAGDAGLAGLFDAHLICPPGHLDCNGVATDGCEAACGAGRACSSADIGCEPGWLAMATAPLAPRRYPFFAVARERGELLVWGGIGPDGAAYGDGARYAWDTNRWSPMAPSPLTPRTGFITAWTGRELFVWGGYSAAQGFLADGAMYDPARDSWRAIATAGAPGPRVGNVAVWTGRRVLVFGGQNANHDAAPPGAQYDPATDAWSPLPDATVAHRPAAAWTGRGLVVWGGSTLAQDCSPMGALATGEVFDPVLSMWTPVNATGAPGARFFAPPSAACSSHVWPAPVLGDEVFIWGGTSDGMTYASDGALLLASTGTWRAIATAPPPLASGGFLPVLVATSSHELLGWSVSSGTAAQNVVYKFDSAHNHWSTMASVDAPAAVIGGAAFGWTGTELVVWGGSTNGSNGVSAGARYYPPP